MGDNFKLLVGVLTGVLLTLLLVGAFSGGGMMGGSMMGGGVLGMLGTMLPVVGNEELGPIAERVREDLTRMVDELVRG